jgi:hypothetical protein
MGRVEKGRRRKHGRGNEEMIQTMNISVNPLITLYRIHPGRCKDFDETLLLFMIHEASAKSI